MSSDGYYKKSDLIGEYLRNKRNGMVLKNLKGKALDLACGDNILIKSYGAQGTGVDIADYGNADLIVSDFCNLPFEAGTFDTVSIVGSLNYFENPEGVLKEVKRILKNNGHLLMTMPNYAIMKIWHRFREPWANKPGFSENDLQLITNKSGFKIVRTEGFLMGLNKLYVLSKAPN